MMLADLRKLPREFVLLIEVAGVVAEPRPALDGLIELFSLH